MLLLGLAITIGLILLLRGFLMAEPKQLAAMLRTLARWTTGALAVLAVSLLIESGRLSLLLIFGLLAAPFLLQGRGRGDWRRWFGRPESAENEPGKTSRIETRLLIMTLDHASGLLTGMVRTGHFQGQTLDQLDFPSLMALHRECQHVDPASLPVLEAWLDRTQGPDWRQRPESASSTAEDGPASPASQAMTRAEALAILGLEPGADPEAVREAYRRLMSKVHPDHGGSTWLAAKLNQAKALLTDF